MYKTLNALILNTETQKEADKALLVFTREHGKMWLVAPGAKKITAKMCGVTEPIMETQFLVYVKTPKSRPKITGAEPIHAFPFLRRSYTHITAAVSCAELLNILVPYNIANPAKYDLLLRTWSALELSYNPALIAVAFSLRLLRLCGYNMSEYIRSRNGANIDQSIIQTISRLSALNAAQVNNLQICKDDMKKIINILSKYVTQITLKKPCAKIYLHTINGANTCNHATA